MGQPAGFLSPSKRPPNPINLCIEKPRRRKDCGGRVQQRVEFAAWYMWYAQIRAISVCGQPRNRAFYAASERRKHYLSPA
jgi:hypothetical protein